MLQSAQIIFKDRPILRLTIDGRSIDYDLREGQVLLIAKQALDALTLAECQGDSDRREGCLLRRE
jgi:hypothetical protein